MANNIQELKEKIHAVKANRKVDELDVESLKQLKENDHRMQLLAIHQNLSYPIMKSLDKQFEIDKIALMGVISSHKGNNCWHQR